MESNLVILLVAVIGGLVSFISEQALSKENNWSILKKINAFILGSVVSGIGTLTLFLANDFSELQKDLEKIDRYLITTNPYAEAVDSIENLGSELSKKLFNERLKKLSKGMEDISREEIILKRNEILNVWEQLISGAKTHVLATNLVDFVDWNYVSHDNAGLTLQKEAIDRGVSITRINLYDESSPSHKEGLMKLTKLQVNAKIDVLNLPLRLIEENESYEDLKQSLETLDIVIIDDEILLLTIVDPKSYKMQWAKLTYSKRKIEIASELFTKLSNDRSLATKGQEE